MRQSGVVENDMQKLEATESQSAMKAFKIVFGLEENNVEKTTSAAYSKYSTNTKALMATAEFQSIVRDLVAENESTPVMMIVRSQGNTQSFRLAELNDFLNGKPTDLERVIRETKVGVEFTHPDFQSVTDLLKTADAKRDMLQQLESWDDNTVLVSSAQGQLTAGELKKSLNVNYSLDGSLPQEDKDLLDKVKKISRAADAKFPHERFNAKASTQHLKVIVDRGYSSEHFQSMTTQHKIKNGSALRELRPKRLDELVYTSVVKVKNASELWKNNYKRYPNATEFKGNVMGGLDDARLVIDEKQKDAQKILAADDKSSPLARAKTMIAKLQKIECEAQQTVINNLERYIDNNTTRTHRINSYTTNPEVVRPGWENSPGLVHRQRSREDVKGDWPVNQNDQQKAVGKSEVKQERNPEAVEKSEVKQERNPEAVVKSEVKQVRKPATTRQSSLNADEFAEHMQKVESRESQRVEQGQRSETVAPRKERNQSLNRGSATPSEAATNSPVIQRLMKVRQGRSASVSPAPEKDDSRAAVSMSKK